MLTISLERNQTDPRRFVAITTFERKGNIVTPIRRVYDGPGHCISSKVVPWPRKDWSGTHNGESDKQRRPHTVKRDWLQLHTRMADLRSFRQGAA